MATIQQPQLYNGLYAATSNEQFISIQVQYKFVLIYFEVKEEHISAAQ